MDEVFTLTQEINSPDKKKITYILQVIYMTL